MSSTSCNSRSTTLTRSFTASLADHASRRGSPRRDRRRCAPNGNILLVEVKAGEPTLIDGNLVKLYGHREHGRLPECGLQVLDKQVRRTSGRLADGLATRVPRIASSSDRAWCAASLLPKLKDDGRLYLLEDEERRLYEPDGFDLNSAVSMHRNDNFCSPRAAVDLINALGLAARSIESRSPYAGELPSFRVDDPTSTVPRHIPGVGRQV